MHGCVGACVGVCSRMCERVYARASARVRLHACSAHTVIEYSLNAGRHRARQHAEEQAEQMYNARYRPNQYQAPPQNWGYNLGRPLNVSVVD